MKTRAWQWFLKVRNGRNHDRLLHKLRLRPSKYDASEYIAFYALDAKPLLLRHIEILKQAGLHGVAKKVPDRRVRTQSEKRQKTKSSGTEKARPAPKKAEPDATIVNLEIAKQNRLAADALKRAIEKRRQAERAAEREVNTRAHQAVLRAKGEV